MSMIKNSYVCVVNGEFKLFGTMRDAEEHAITIAYKWHDAGANLEEEPVIVVMPVIDWFQVQGHLHQLAF